MNVIARSKASLPPAFGIEKKHGKQKFSHQNKEDEKRHGSITAEHPEKSIILRPG